MDRLLFSPAPARAPKASPPANLPKALTVGIPRALCYHPHGRLWENFFTLLGCNVLVSPQTNREILDLGVKSSGSETCLPVKVLAGHALLLADKVDLLFIPRIVSTAPGEIACPKFCSLPDMVRLLLRSKTEVMEATLDFKNGLSGTEDSLRPLAARLSQPADAVRSAFFRAVRNRMRADMEAAELAPHPVKPGILLLGHPYMLGDPFLCMNAARKLRAKGFEVFTPSDFDYGTRRKNAYPYQGRLFYEVGLDNLGSAFAGARSRGIRGMIYITPFACGVDSLTTEFIERHLKAEECEIPFMKVTVDEQTGEAGFDTRLEAFTDMIGGE